MSSTQKTVSDSEYSVGYHYPLEDEEMIRGYKIIEKIGSGRFCRVYKVDKNEKNFAMKIYKSSSGYKEYFDNEVKNHILLKNDLKYKEYIVEMIEYFTHESSYGNHGIIIFELCGNTLEDLLKSTQEGTLPEPIVKHIMKQVVNGLRIFHEKNLIHTDLKPENILLTKEFKLINSFDEIVVKISDLGSSLKEDEIDTYSVGTDQYLPPEVVMRADYDKTIDIWGIGNIIFELITGENLIDPGQYYNDDDEETLSDDDDDNNTTNSSECSDDDSEDCGDFEYIHTHISLFHKILGPIPSELIQSGENYDLFYCKSGKLNRIPRYIDKTTIKEIFENEYNFTDPETINNLDDVLKFILKYLPKNRPTIDELLTHKWFEGDYKIQYQNLLDKLKKL
jgi:serine/threonine protein kinase